MTAAQLTGGALSGGFNSKSTEWNAAQRKTRLFCLGQSRLRYEGVLRNRNNLPLNHKRLLLLPSLLTRRRQHNFYVVTNQLSSDCGINPCYVDTSSTVEEHRQANSNQGAYELKENPCEERRSRDVKHELMMLSLPGIAGQALEPLAQLMETAYIGRLGPVELASAGVSMSIFNIISKLFNMPLLSVATSFVAEDISKTASRNSISEEGSQLESSNGRPSYGLTRRLKLSSVSSALFLAVAIGVFEALALSLGSGLFLNLMGISLDSSMRAPAQQFLCFRALGAPALVASLALQGIFRGFKDTKTPVLCLGIGNFLAIFLFPILIYYFQLGVTGAAISTVISQYIVTFLMIWHLSKRAVLLPPNLTELQFGSYMKSAAWIIFVPFALTGATSSVGGFLIGRTLAVLITMTLATSLAARQGPVAMAAHQICLQIWLAVSLLMDAFAASGQTLIASFLSEGDYRTLREVTLFVLKVGFLTGASLAVILGVSFSSLVTLFSKDAEVLGVVGTGILFVSASQPVNALAFIFDGLHYGVSDFSYAACSMMLVGAISSAFLLYSSSVFGLYGVWSGLALFMGLRMVAGYVRLLSKNGPWWFLHKDLKRFQHID